MCSETPNLWKQIVFYLLGYAQLQFSWNVSLENCLVLVTVNKFRELSSWVPNSHPTWQSTVPSDVDAPTETEISPTFSLQTWSLYRDFRQIFSSREWIETYTEGLPWINGEIYLKDIVQIFFLGGHIRHNLVHLSYDGPKQRGCAEEKEDAKHLHKTRSVMNSIGQTDTIWDDVENY